MTTQLKTVLIGCGFIGKFQARALKEHPEYELVAVCDVVNEAAQRLATEFGVKAYTDVQAMLKATKPDVVIIGTSTTTHASLTTLAVESGVKGVYCEKPMATNMKDARAMVEICKTHNVALAIGHLRRVCPDLVAAREVIASGAIGDLLLARGDCAGDLLSDGSHLVDSLQWLTGDQEVKWVFGQVNRDLAAARAWIAAKGLKKEPCTRYGHVVESGGMGVYQLASGVRAEIFCGNAQTEHRPYQSYEIFGTKGRLWRIGDMLRPNLFMEDAQGGPLAVALNDKSELQPLPCAAGQKGSWRAVDFRNFDPMGMFPIAFDVFAKMMREGAPNPMSGEISLLGFEVIMAIYESARLRKKIELPLQQDRFPLEIMVEKGEM
jgi:predicted dehydrogenase